jgi:hypothetical protein
MRVVHPRPSGVQRGKVSTELLDPQRLCDVRLTGQSARMEPIPSRFSLGEMPAGAREKLLRGFEFGSAKLISFEQACLAPNGRRRAAASFNSTFAQPASAAAALTSPGAAQTPIVFGRPRV